MFSNKNAALSPSSHQLRKIDEGRGSQPESYQHDKAVPFHSRFSRIPESQMRNC